VNSKSLRNIGGFLVLIMPVLAGCGGGDIPRVDVVGEVMLDGEPVSEAHIYLTATSSLGKETRATFSASVVDGQFEFTGGDRPPPGDYEIVVKPLEPDAEEAFEELRNRNAPLIQDRNKFLAAVTKKGPIRIDLTMDDVNQVMIELSSR